MPFEKTLGGRLFIKLCTINIFPYVMIFMGFCFVAEVGLFSLESCDFLGLVVLV